jgi:hypothetical protein
MDIGNMYIVKNVCFIGLGILITDFQASVAKDTNLSPMAFECPKGITPANTDEQLVYNMLYFVKNDYYTNKYTVNDIHCYFNGQVYWEQQNSAESMQQYTNPPEATNNKYPYSIKIAKINVNDNYYITIYPKIMYGNTVISLQGKNIKFNPLSFLNKYFDIDDRIIYKKPKEMFGVGYRWNLDSPSSFYIEARSNIIGDEQIFLSFLKFSNDGDNFYINQKDSFTLSFSSGKSNSTLIKEL